MLKLQYDRQLRMSQEFNLAYKLDLQGYAVQTKAPNGIFPDGWVSSDFSIEFRPTRPARELVLEAQVPSNLEEDQLLELQSGDWSATETVKPGESRNIRIPLDGQAGDTVGVSIHAHATARPPGGVDTRELAWYMASAVLEH
jgi:hypothetical protein